jgi:FkbM family methyltransferase
MNIDSNDLLRSFQGSLPINLKLLSHFFQVRELVIHPEEASPLYLLDDDKNPASLFIPLDTYIGMETLLTKQYFPQTIHMMNEVIQNENRSYTLIDIGANIGLYARQSLNILKKIDKIFAYEPHPNNYALLLKNLANIKSAEMNMFGLGACNASLEFYLDPSNNGNYSLNKHAMTEAHGQINVDIKNACEESQKWMSLSGDDFIYKSDTQGHDETIVSAIDPSFWPRVKCGVLELWRIGGKDYDQDSFVRMLDSFPCKMFEKAPGKNVSSLEVLQFLNSSDGLSEDLLFWRV